MSRLIDPRVLSGFRDYPPELMIPREHLLDTARRVYRSYGFAPIDTPALELTEVLLAKAGGETAQQVYRFRDQGDRDVALRFDLTVPLARFAAQHVTRLGTPFKRYHLGTVWRGERPGAGRYREFMQCDFDIIGTTSNAADTEIALVICDLFAALGFSRFEVRLNNRLILNGVLEQIGLLNKSTELLRALDKLPKIGRDGVRTEMMEQSSVDEDGKPVPRAEATAEQADRVIDLAETQGDNDEVLARVEQQWGTSPGVQQGVARLREVLSVARTAGVPDGRIRVDLSICRGLDYYTGTVYETFLLDLPKIGSVCSGGRYDDLASSYTKQQLPGVGASLGLDRLLAAMEELNLVPKVSTTAPVLVVQFAADRLGDYQRLARILRDAGIGAEVYPEAKKLGQQFQYAERRGHTIAVIAGPDEFTRGDVKLKDLARRTESTVAEGELVSAVRAILGAAPDGP